MAVDSSGYLGDDDLGSLLWQAGSDRSVEDIRKLIDGVNAAPVAMDPDAWLDLLGGASLPEPLRGQLKSLRALMAERSGGMPTDHDHPARVAALRAELARRGLAGFVVPRSDEHQGEYVPARAERLAWITGFTGSAGLAVVMLDQAAVFVDGRYTLQVQGEVSPALFQYKHLTDDPHADWITAALPKGGRLGYDPWLHTVGWVERLRSAVGRAGGELLACPDNPIDAIWRDQPPAPLAPVVPHDLRFAGKSAAEKRDDVACTLRNAGQNAAVLTQPDSIAWLLNIRGGDVPRTPLPLSFAIVDDGGDVDLFIDRRKLVPAVIEHLGNRVSIRAPDEFGPALDGLGGRGAKVRVDPASSAAWIFDRLLLANAKVERDGDPVALPKARKNEVELAGTRTAHARDAVAVARFLAWISEVGPSGEVGEIEAAEKLLAFRREGDLFRDQSFDTISGAGPNGAIVHYRVSPKTERRLAPGNLYLVDSGAQYLDGTTDITRTIAIGQPTDEMRERFTLVLKGHIAIATARFPKGTTGSQLDCLARHALWQKGLDFDHGTGHGVGSYLSVHEGPQRISKVGNTVALEPGMIVSNEPGYYRTGAYGIRIENLVAVRPCPELETAERPMLSFETLTLAPIDLALVEPTLMSSTEIAWLNTYHAWVRDSLADRLDGDTAAWLIRATDPIVP
ncbi:X-Pro aminopeptidase [Skermanella stibiiresistens SB22]|uniref:X-Pro aminopeptidase n=1 Tax=Skermanella stibiiresistens SB22 TaxID=1385369 RepID=W9H2P6_9PROT|nr:aminopeptidase P family protein [Skermanella stibiiresistens]EWY40324.1 X-Pro aminopeptidase [Skermanella stibiiresistens SB22]